MLSRWNVDAADLELIRMGRERMRLRQIGHEIEAESVGKRVPFM